jgi:hypothetical protein
MGQSMELFARIYHILKICIKSFDEGPSNLLTFLLNNPSFEGKQNRKSINAFCPSWNFSHTLNSVKVSMIWVEGNFFAQLAQALYSSIRFKMS